MINYTKEEIDRMPRSELIDELQSISKKFNNKIEEYKKILKEEYDDKTKETLADIQRREERLKDDEKNFNKDTREYINKSLSEKLDSYISQTNSWINCTTNEERESFKVSQQAYKWWYFGRSSYLDTADKKVEVVKEIQDTLKILDNLKIKFYNE
jgi:hypothetical protein